MKPIEVAALTADRGQLVGWPRLLAPGSGGWCRRRWRMA
jgi:hypothetical protein